MATRSGSAKGAAGALVAGVYPVMRACDAKKIAGIEKVSSDRRGQSVNRLLIGAQKFALYQNPCSTLPQG
jgi:hypothetical protein